MKLTLAYSPCPNDTFIFYALIHKKIDTEGLDFEVVLDDVEALNQAAQAGRHDITKLSFHAYVHLMKQYALLHSGAALGNNCGPLLLSKYPILEHDINSAKIAIPGEWTTANFLMHFAYPKAQHKTPMLFSAIETAVLDGTMDLGVIIHENRFTYQEKGLVKVKDLGAHWETQTGLPIPLGGIALHKRHGAELWEKVNRIIRRSLEYAYEHVDETLPYLRVHAQEMQESVMMQHVKLYVNEYSLDLGEKGLAAVEKLIDEVQKGQ